MCTVGLYVSLCLMIFSCPFLPCKALRTAMYKRYISSIIIIIIIITEMDSMIVHIINNFRIPVRAKKNTCKRFLVTTCIDPSTRDKLDRPVDRSTGRSNDNKGRPLRLAKPRADYCDNSAERSFLFLSPTIFDSFSTLAQPGPIFLHVNPYR